MLYRRIYQFFIVYLIGLSGLFAFKYILGLSDYVIPAPAGVWASGRQYGPLFLISVLDTLGVALHGVNRIPADTPAGA